MHSSNRRWLVPGLAVPAAQGAHTVWDALTEYVPGPHTPVQFKMSIEPAVSVVEVATGHAKQPASFNIRDSGEYVPLEHKTHTSVLWPPTVPDAAYVPGPHSLQPVCPRRKANVPASHSAHTLSDVALTAVEYLPAPQCRQ